MSAQGYGQDSNKAANNVFLCDAGNKLSDASGGSIPVPTTSSTPLFRSDFNQFLKNDLTPPTVDGDRIRRWVDLSGNNNHFEQTDTVKQLLYETDFVGFSEPVTPSGSPAVMSEPSDAVNDSSLVSPFNLAPPFTMIMVARPKVASGTRMFGLGTGNVEMIAQNTTSFIFKTVGDQYNFNSTTGDTRTAVVKSITLDVPSQTDGFKVYTNGANETTQNSNAETITSAAMHVGSDDDTNLIGGGVFWELWVWDSIISDADRQMVEDYLYSKYQFTPERIKDVRNPTLKGDLLNGAVHNDTIILDGVDDTVFWDTTAFNFEYNQPFSIEVIIKPDTGNGVIVSNQLNTAADNRGWELIWLSATNNGRINIRNSDGSTILIKVDTPTSSLPAATDSHWIMTYDGSNLASGVTNYINGQLVANTVVNDTLGANTIVDAAQRLYIGARAGVETPYDGEVEVVEIYDIELTGTETFDKWKAIRNRLS